MFKKTVEKFSNDGTPIYRISTNSRQSVGFNEPNAVDVDDDGNIYIADKDNDRVVVLTSSGEFSYSIGEKSSCTDPGCFNEVVDLDVSNRKLFVADTNNARIQVFNSASGSFEYSIGGVTWGTGPDEFYSISGIAVDDNTGKIYVSEEYLYYIKVFSSSGAFEYTIGSGLDDDAPGSLYYPKQLAIDANSNIYVAENENQRVSVFTSDGTFQYSITNNFGASLGVDIDTDQNIYIQRSRVIRIFPK